MIRYFKADESISRVLVDGVNIVVLTNYDLREPLRLYCLRCDHPSWWFSRFYYKSITSNEKNQMYSVTPKMMHELRVPKIYVQQWWDMIYLFVKVTLLFLVMMIILSAFRQMVVV